MTEETLATADPALGLAEAVRAAALAVPGVVDLSPGVGFVEATYGRNTTVLGVGLDPGPQQIGINLHLVVTDEPIPALAAVIRAAVRARVELETGIRAAPINLWIDDMRFGDWTPETRGPV